MKNKTDSRVNASYVSGKEYALYFFILAAFSGFHMWIYGALEHSGLMETNTQLAINTLILYVMATAALLTAVIAFIRDRFFINPIKKLSTATRDIARGDFSVRIKPWRNDKKKDLFDVMIDDFNKMAEELASIETMKNEFIANVSHEIKTPLSIIQHYTTALRNESMEEKERLEYTQTILEATQKLSVLVTNILKLSKLENQEIVSEVKPFDLSEQIRRCSLNFADQFEQKNISFEEDLDEIIINSEANMLEIVWNNLISNAVKFTEPGGKIYISLKVQQDSIQNFVQVSVTDTGCGMDEAIRKRIFDKFYQGETSRSREGNGLGLALVKKTMDLLGGTVTADSTLEHGSTFTVCLKI